MAKIIDGNIEKLPEFSKKGGWFFGSFIKDLPEFRNDNFEIKWANNKAGYYDYSRKTDYSAMTLAINVSGHAKITFPDKNEVFTLSNPGDFVYWDTQDGDHIFESLDNSIVIAIRWPSRKIE